MKRGHCITGYKNTGSLSCLKIKKKILILPSVSWSWLRIGNGRTVLILQNIDLSIYEFYFNQKGNRYFFSTWLSGSLKHFFFEQVCRWNILVLAFRVLPNRLHCYLLSLTAILTVLSNIILPQNLGWHHFSLWFYRMEKTGQPT